MTTADSRSPAGPVLDGLGVTLDLDEHEQVTDVLVLVKTKNFDSDAVAVQAQSGSSPDWVSVLGLYHACRRLLVDPGGPGDD